MTQQFINLLLVISFILFLEIVFVVLVGYVGIIIGHRANKNKMVNSIATGFGLYMFTMLYLYVLLVR